MRADARTITRTLGGRWHAQNGRAGCPACADNNNANPSLSISQGANGALLLHCFKGCSFAEILNALRGMGLMSDSSAVRPHSAEDIRQQRAEFELEAVRRATLAARCWREAGPISGTLAEAYLRGRGITCVLPTTLRFHPDCWHVCGKRFPALVAKIEGAASPAIHRTYLCGPRKAEVTPAKAMLGSVKGGAVRLTEGDGSLVVAEGIETALSLACGLLSGHAAIWAALSTSGMKALNLPQAPGDLIVAVDGEKAGREAGRALAQRAIAQGWTVYIADPGDGLDFNDILLRERA